MYFQLSFCVLTDGCEVWASACFTHVEYLDLRTSKLPMILANTLAIVMGAFEETATRPLGTVGAPTVSRGVNASLRVYIHKRTNK